MNDATLYQRLNVSPETLAQFCQQAQILQLACFGSVLRDDFGPHSDIDLLVTFDPNLQLSLLGLVGLEQQLEDLFHRKVDLVEKPVVATDRDGDRRSAILSQAKTLYESRSLVSPRHRPMLPRNPRFHSGH